MCGTIFLVETYVGQGDREQFASAVEALRTALAAMIDPHTRVHYAALYLVPNDEMGVHVVEADDVKPSRGWRSVPGSR
jgi:hypothetical protein